MSHCNVAMLLNPLQHELYLQQNWIGRTGTKVTLLRAMSINKNFLIMVYKSNRNTINHQKINNNIIHPTIQYRSNRFVLLFVSSVTNHDQSISIKVHLFQKRNSPAQCFYYRNYIPIYFGFLCKNSELRRNSQVCNKGPQVVSRFEMCLREPFKNVLAEFVR